MNKIETEPEAPWAYLEDHHAEDSMLKGNREGLVLLRESIDRAIQEGECDIPDGDVLILGVRRIDGPQETVHESFGSKCTVIGCLAILVLCFLIFVYGLLELYRKLF